MDYHNFMCYFLDVRTVQMLLFMKCSGQRGIEHQHEEEWCKRASVLCEERFAPEEREELRRIMQKAAFSESDIIKEEFSYYISMLDEAEYYIWQKMGRIQKGYMSILGLRKCSKRV